MAEYMQIPPKQAGSFYAPAEIGSEGLSLRPHFHSFGALAMRTILSNPQHRFALALGASIGIGMPLFRGLTENLGPIVGLLVFLPAIALIAGGLALVLDRAGKNMIAAENK